MQIREIMKRDLDERIEEIIQVSQRNDKIVYDEINEYIATENIKQQFKRILEAIAGSPSDRTTNFEVWISGFFGSGKSSFAKLLGYVLMNPKLTFRRPDGREEAVYAAELIKRQFDFPVVSDLIDSINARMPYEVIMFDVQTDREMSDSGEDLAAIMYRNLLRHLDYCSNDMTIAELEMTLEERGELDRFIAICEQTPPHKWRLIRKGSERFNVASSALHEMDPRTYPMGDSWAKTVNKAETRVTVGVLVERAFELTRRRKPKRALAFVIDEVGAYVARSNAKIENLRNIVETFGRVSVDMVQRGEAVAPVWTIITSQEKLEEVVAALDSRIVEIAKVQDRFRHRVDLASSDIREVVTKRVLSKKESALPDLHKLYQQAQGQLNTACRIHNSARYRSDLTPEHFAQFYPYLPHYIDLSIDIVSGLRTQGNQILHIGGANRTLIKQAHAMLVSERTHLADAQVGVLVTVDKIYELVESSIASEKARDISTIVTLKALGDGDQQSWPARVAKAICLLENVRDLRSSEQNLAALLVDQVGFAAPVNEVHTALEKLEAAQFIRLFEDGYRLLTAIERGWDDERRNIGEPSFRDQNEIRDAVLKEIFDLPALKAFRYQTRTFRLGLLIDDRSISDGQIELRLFPTYANDEMTMRLDQARANTRSQQHPNALYWIFQMSPTTQKRINDIHASQEMLKRHQHESAAGQSSGDRNALVEDEKKRLSTARSMLRIDLVRDFATGKGIFKGVTADAATLGNDMNAIIHRMLNDNIPEIFPNFETGAMTLTGKEAEEILKAANLRALSQVFYQKDLVIKQAGVDDFVANKDAPLTQEMLNYLNRQKNHGVDVNGKLLIETFVEGAGYGWTTEVVQLALAVLLRAGAIEVITGGRRFRTHQDPPVRQPFTGTQAFKSASFAPRQAVDRQLLAKAALAYEGIAGHDVDVNAGAIDEAMKRLADSDRPLVHDALTNARAHQIPVGAVLQEYREYIEEFLHARDDDTVKALAEKGASIKRARQQSLRIGQVLTEANLQTFQQARTVLQRQWPQLQRDDDAGAAADQAERLRQTLAASDCYEQLATIRDLTRDLTTAYEHTYIQRHSDRADAYRAAIDIVQAGPEWDAADVVRRDDALRQLIERACPSADLPDGALTCRQCHRDLGQLREDLGLVDALRLAALNNLQKLIPLPPAPTPDVVPDNADGPQWEERPMRRVRAATVFRAPLRSVAEVDAALARLRAQLVAAIEAGADVTVE